MSNQHTDKQTLRGLVAARVNALSGPQRQREAEATCTATLAAWQQAGTPALAAYVALRDELDLATVATAVWSRGLVLWLPRCVAGDTLAWHPIAHAGQLRTGAYGISEPDPTQMPASALPADAMLLVPGRAFTRAGHRLGRGRGFYDRALADHRGRSIGIGFACQLVQVVPQAAHDRILDAVLLGGEWIKPLA